MAVKLTRVRGWWIVSLLSVVGFASTDGNLRLVAAVKKGDRETVRSLLMQHTDVNVPEADGATALAWAAHRGDLETAELLIRNGANANTENDYHVTPLSLACLNGDAAMVEFLLKAGANPNASLASGETALMMAARTGNVDAVKSLLAYGGDVNAKESGHGQTALMWAVAESHAEVARVLIEHGADIHARSNGGFTALLFAAQSGNLDSARILLAAGANVNEGTAEDGSALVVASASGHEALAIFLLDKGADSNAADGNGITSLHYALLKGISILDTVRFQEVNEQPVPLAYLFRPNLRELVKALLAHGANPNARIIKDPLLPLSQREVISPVGATPLVLAAATKDGDIMRLLVGRGADPLLATKEHTTALIIAAGVGDRLCKLPTFTERRTKDDDARAVDAVKLAVELGADVNAANTFGVTAIHGAALVGSDEMIRFLTDRGAHVNVSDKGGQTPLSIAENIVPTTLKISDLRPFFGRKRTADLLRSLGAIPIAQRTQATAP
jgi:uncharacterized protein